MRLSVDSYAVRERFGDETAITMLSEAGFDAIDYSMYWWKETDGPFGNDYRAYAKTLRTAAEKNGIIFNQAHSILESYVFDSPSNQERFERILRSIEFASLLGAETIIVHPIRCPMGIDPVSFNVEFFRKFECTCKKFKIKVALENLFGRKQDGTIYPSICSYPEEFHKCMDLLDRTYFTACVDVGHALVVGQSPENVLREMDDRVTALHIHDNYGIYDDHMLPGFGKIDWHSLMQTLEEIHYRGDFTMEIFAWLQHFDDAVFPEALKLAAKVGRTLIGQLRNDGGILG